MNFEQGTIDSLRQRVAKLEAELAKYKEQEPYCYVIPGEDNANDTGYLDANIFMDGEFTRPLYACPVPAKVPEGWKLVPDEPTNYQIASGLSAYSRENCLMRDVWVAMLATAPDFKEKE